MPEQDSIMEALMNDGEETVTTGSPQVEQKTIEQPNVTGTDEAARSEAASDGSQAEAGATDGDPKTEVEDDKKNVRPDKQSRLNERFGELTGKLKEKDEFIESLQRDLDAATNKVPELKRDENGDVDVNDLIEHNKQVAENAAKAENAALRLELDGEKVAVRFDSEVDSSLKAHPMLDPNNKEQFNPKVAAIVERLVQEKVGPHLLAKNVSALSKISPAKIINEYMEGVYAAAEAARGEAAKNLNNLRGQSSGVFDSGGVPPSKGDNDPIMKVLLADD